MLRAWWRDRYAAWQAWRGQRRYDRWINGLMPNTQPIYRRRVDDPLAAWLFEQLRFEIPSSARVVLEQELLAYLRERSLPADQLAILRLYRTGGEHSYEGTPQEVLQPIDQNAMIGSWHADMPYAQWRQYTRRVGKRLALTHPGWPTVAATDYVLSSPGEVHSRAV